MHDTRFNDRKLQTNVSTTSFQPPPRYFREIGETKVVKLYYYVSLRSLPVDFVVRCLEKIYERTYAYVKRERERRGCLFQLSSRRLEKEEIWKSCLVKSTGGTRSRWASIGPANELLLTSFEARSFPYLNFRAAKRGENGGGGFSPP